MTKYIEIKQTIIFEFTTTTGHQQKHGLDAVSLVIDDWMQDSSNSKVIKLMIVNKLLQLGIELTSSFFIGTRTLLETFKNQVTLMDMERELTYNDMEDLMLDILKTNTLIKDARIVSEPGGY